VRLFLGIPLAGAVLAELTTLSKRLRSTPDLRWSAPESWHITLQFLGSVSDEQYGCLIERLAGLRSAPVPVRLGGLGVFDRAGIFYAGVELTPQLDALQSRVVAATAPCGFEPESRPYHPHITLARGKGPKCARELHTFLEHTPSRPKFSRFTAMEFLLYESHLSSAGSTYEVRQRFQLTAET
jgi:RNA 2',3'-cyclic 3'-phosphodiesterase